MFREKNVAGVATIHDPLRDIDSGACDVESVINISDLIDWGAVNSHPQTDGRIFFQLLSDFQGAADRVVRALEEKKRHAVAGRQSNQLSAGFGASKTFRVSHDPTELLNRLDLFVH